LGSLAGLGSPASQYSGDLAGNSEASHKEKHCLTDIPGFLLTTLASICCGKILFSHWDPNQLATRPVPPVSSSFLNKRILPSQVKHFSKTSGKKPQLGDDVSIIQGSFFWIQVHNSSIIAIIRTSVYALDFGLFFSHSSSHMAEPGLQPGWGKGFREVLQK